MAKDISKVAYIVTEVLMISLGKSLPHRIAIIFPAPELSIELRTVIAGISRFDD
jgi:hypothetical protein